MRPLFGHDALVAEWVGQRIPHVGNGASFGQCAAIGLVDDEGIIQAGAVYNNFQPQYRNIEISFGLAAKGRLTREAIRILLRYPFAQLNCRRCTAITPLKATSTRAFLEKLDFRREGVVRHGFGNDHAVIYGLLDHHWARHPFNRERQHA